ncbi:MAG TPA: Rho termination factor N-terminal domain-containing protein [Solirubrobacteraceae bacterium]|nr:Rho termination factor N-terminal domain-containing protein [Solirubrobacteraceae bacterium]
MAVLERSELEASPLADLHAIADQIGLDGFRRLRKADLIGAILERSGGDGGRDRGVVPAGRRGSGDADSGDADSGDADSGDADSGKRGSGDRGSGEGGEEDATSDRPATRRRRASRSRRARSTAEDQESELDTAPADATAESESESAPRRRPSRTRRTRAASDAGEDDARTTESSGRVERSERAERPERTERSDRAPRRGARAGREERAPLSERTDEREVEGVVELLGNGSAFLRVSPPEASDEDVYVSAAQVRRCELVSGDRVSGPVRSRRPSERYPSLARVDTINGASAESVAEGTRYEDLPVTYPTERIELDAQDPTLGAIEWLTPIGRGSRALIVGAARAGKTEVLRRLRDALSGREGLELMVVLSGVRPEEIAAWREGSPAVAPAAALNLAASADLQGQTVEHVVETAKRVAARGGDVVVLIDSLDDLPPQVARKVLANARNLVDGGSLTVIATATQPFGGESTVIALDVALTSTGRLPALDLVASGTVKPELLVGEDGAEAITKARAAALEGS